MPSLGTAGACAPRINFTTHQRICLTAGLLLGAASLLAATRYGWSRGGTDLGACMIWGAVGLAAGLIALVAPSELLAAIARRDRVRALLATAALLLCAPFAIAGALGSATSGRAVASQTEQHGQDARQRATASHARAVAELATLPPARPAAELQAAMQPLDVQIGNADCAGWLANKSLRAACIDRNKLQVELARAKRRVQLQKEIAAVAQKLDAAPVSPPANSDATSVARYLGAMGVQVDAATVADWLTILAVLTVELGGGLALALARGPARRGEAQTQPAARPDSAAMPLLPPASPVVATGQPRAPARRPNRHAAARATAKAVRAALDANGGKFAGTMTDLARATGRKRATVHAAVRDMATAGQAAVRAGRRGTAIRLLDA